jgi:hypothetical protein
VLSKHISYLESSERKNKFKSGLDPIEEIGLKEESSFRNEKGVDSNLFANHSKKYKRGKAETNDIDLETQGFLIEGLDRPRYVENQDELLDKFLKTKYIEVLGQIEIEEEFEAKIVDVDEDLSEIYNDEDSEEDESFDDSRRSFMLGSDDPDPSKNDVNPQDQFEENPNDVASNFKLGVAEIDEQRFSEKLKFHFTRVYNLNERYQKHIVAPSLGT